MKRILFAIVLACSVFTQARAQLFYRASEFGLSFGGSQYFGDLNDEYGFKYVRPAGGAFFRYHLNPYISVRASVSYTKIGYDDNLNNNDFAKTRNLSFRSDIFEGVLQAEFNFFRFSTGEHNSRWTPYITLGVGAFYYNPSTVYGGTKYYLRNLGTEGQFVGYEDRKYNTASMCFPVGAGFKYWIAPGFNLGFEIADRLTLTDYMDDVSTTYVGADKFPNDPQNPNPAYILQDPSMTVNGQKLGREGKQRGNNATKDQYMYFMINLSIQFRTYKCPNYLKRGDLLRS